MGEGALMIDVSAVDWDAVHEAVAAEMRKSPFTDFTLLEDGSARRRVLQTIGSAYTAPVTSYGRRGPSFVEQSLIKGNALDRADEAIYNAARQALNRQKKACAAIAEKFSPEAAVAILALADMPEWVKP